MAIATFQWIRKTAVLNAVSLVFVLQLVFSDRLLAAEIVAPDVILKQTSDEVIAVLKDKREEFFQTLLHLNASEMLHGAYGLEEGFVVTTDALELENLDYNEFQATLDDISLAVTKHYPVLSKFAPAEAA